MFQIDKLKNGLNLITINLPHLDSLTTLIAIPAGSRYETPSKNGISHFLEHMFFKGSKKYPSPEMIAEILDGIGAVNNAATSIEYTHYWIKSAANHIDTACDILSSMLKESLFDPEEIEREKGVVIEEMRMVKDNPARYIWHLYESLQFGNQPIGMDVLGEEKTVSSITRSDLLNYTNSLYAPSKMALVFVGKLPKNIKQIAEKYFANLNKNSHFASKPYKKIKQTKPKVNLFYKKTDQACLILGVEAYDRYDPRRFAAKLLSTILGSGMSSRLFIEVREKRGLAYSVFADFDPMLDTGTFACYAGLKMEKMEEGLKVILAELERIKSEPITENELAKAKEMEKGHLALQSESTNFLATHFSLEYIFDHKLESFPDYLKQIDAVTISDIQAVAKDLFQLSRYNLQIIAPLKSTTSIEKILAS